MSPDSVRNMDNYDFMAHMQMCLAREEFEKTSEAKNSSPPSSTRSNKYNTSGVKTTNIMSF